MGKFNITDVVIKCNTALLEEIEKVDYKNLSKDERDFLFSQYRRTVGKLVIILQNE